MDYDALERLVGLRDSGALTNVEFEQQKQILLQREGDEATSPVLGSSESIAHLAERFRLRQSQGTPWRRYGLGLFVAVLVLSAGAFAYIKVADWRATQAAHQAAVSATKKAVAEQTAGATDLLKTDYDGGTITYAQLFDKVEYRLKKIEDASVSAQASDIEPSQREAVSVYAKSLAETLRLLEMKYRKKLSVDSNLEIAKSTKDDYYSTPYNEYSDQWERRRMTKAINEARDSVSEYKLSASNFSRSLKSLKGEITANSPKLSGYSLVSTAVIDKAIAKNDAI